MSQEVSIVRAWPEEASRFFQPTQTSLIAHPGKCYLRTETTYLRPEKVKVVAGDPRGNGMEWNSLDCDTGRAFFAARTIVE